MDLNCQSSSKILLHQKHLMREVFQRQICSLEISFNRTFTHFANGINELKYLSKGRIKNSVNWKKCLLKISLTTSGSLFFWIWFNISRFSFSSTSGLWFVFKPCFNSMDPRFPRLNLFKAGYKSDTLVKHPQWKQYLANVIELCRRKDWWHLKLQMEEAGSFQFRFHP